MALLSGALLLAIFGLAHAQLENPDLTQMFDSNSCDEAFSVVRSRVSYLLRPVRGSTRA